MKLWTSPTMEALQLYVFCSAEESCWENSVSRCLTTEIFKNIEKKINVHIISSWELGLVSFKSFSSLKCLNSLKCPCIRYSIDTEKKSKALWYKRYWSQVNIHYLKFKSNHMRKVKARVSTIYTTFYLQIFFFFF